MIDKSQIKPIVEGQTGREVANNLKANFDFTIDKTNEEVGKLETTVSTNKETTDKKITELEKTVNDNGGTTDGKITEINKKIEDNKVETDKKIGELAYRKICACKCESSNLSSKGNSYHIEMYNAMLFDTQGKYTNPFNVSIDVAKDEILILSSLSTEYASPIKYQAVYVLKDTWSNLGKYRLEDVLFINSSFGVYSKIPELSSLRVYTDNGINNVKELFYSNEELKPINAFDNITTLYKTGIFTSLPLVNAFIANGNELYVKEIIYKSNDDKFNLVKMHFEGSVLKAESGQEVINLKPEWKDASLGNGVYRIPFNKTVNYIIGTNKFYFLNADNDNGYFAKDKDINHLGADAKKAIALGVVIRLQKGQKQTQKNTEDIVANKEAIRQNTLAIENLSGTSILVGKKIGFLGNSITEYGQYVNAFKKITGCVAVNYGVAGTHIAYRTPDDKKCFEERYKTMAADLDMVVVFGGTNDFGHSQTAEFGAFTDYINTSKKTFYAGLHRLFKGLYDKYRGKPIVVMTPLHHGTEIDTPEYTISDNILVEGKNPKTQKTFKDYVNAIKEVAAYYSLPILDAYAESGLNPMLEVGAENRYYFKDGLHQTQAGGDRLAKWMKPQLENIYKQFYL